MTTYYVRKSGNDGNAGTSAGAAWLTVDKAASTVSAGDTVYIGAGVYRELVTMDASGSSGNEILFIGDLTGLNTGDAGPVLISAFDSDTGNPSRAAAYDPNHKIFVEWYNVLFLGGTTAALNQTGAGTSGYEGCIFENCHFYKSNSNVDRAVYLDLNVVTAPSGNGARWNNCSFFGLVEIEHDQNASAEVDLDWQFNNCIFTNWGQSTPSALYWECVTTSTYDAGGVTLNNCTFFGTGYAVTAWNCDQTTNPVAVYNSVFNGVFVGLRQALGTSGSLVGDYNHFCNVQTKYSGVSAGANDVEGFEGVLVGGMGDLVLYQALGWSPFKPFEPMFTADGAYANGVISGASATYAPATDFYGRSRPAHTGSDDAGAVEATRGLLETSTTQAGGNGGRIEAAGQHDIFIPVPASSTTISLYMRYDANYTGSLPQITVTDIDGVVDQTDTMAAAANTWEELTVTFTPSNACLVRLKVLSRDTSSNGNTYFDTLTVS